jgi:hypothetical protein
VTLTAKERCRANAVKAQMRREIIEDDTPLLMGVVRRLAELNAAPLSDKDVRTIRETAYRRGFTQGVREALRAAQLFRPRKLDEWERRLDAWRRRRHQGALEEPQREA